MGYRKQCLGFTQYFYIGQHFGVNITYITALYLVQAGKFCQIVSATKHMSYKTHVKYTNNKQLTRSDDSVCIWQALNVSVLANYHLHFYSYWHLIKLLCGFTRHMIATLFSENVKFFKFCLIVNG